ncbi:MAG: type III-A CRISPR-associated RAMP protein Csm3 [Anaerolineae bacterium]|nr:type III-A CRISPR-associated RAMP protein Csm3 [Anaerolineae bacterium]
MGDINLCGRIIITMEIHAVTGLHIGGSSVGLEIGGLDKAVIRNPLNNEPYIPGSSLRGKMRSQLEKKLGLKQNNHIGQVTIHTCKKRDEYNTNGGCPVCHIFGVPGEVEATGPTLLVVRDVALTRESAAALDKLKSDLPFAELKTEVAIDRVTSAATPRTIERVPAGAVFGPAELVFSIYAQADFARLKYVLEALQLVEDDYLGGSGSRGSGKVKFANIHVSARNAQDYATLQLFENGKAFESVQALAQKFDVLNKWAQDVIKTG